MAPPHPLLRLLATEATYVLDEPSETVPLPASQFSSASRAFARAARDRARGDIQPAFSLANAYETLVMERWVSGDASALPPWALAAFYRIRRAIPRRVQLALRRVLIKRQGVPDFPKWPYDESVRDLLAALAAILAAPDQKEIRF